MKQGKHYLSIVIWIFLAAIVAYFGYNLATSLYTVTNFDFFSSVS